MNRFVSEKLAVSLQGLHLVQWVNEDGMPQRGMSRLQLANAVGVSKGYIDQLARQGKENPSFDVVVKIADVLGVDLYDLTRKRSPVTLTQRAGLVDIGGLDSHHQIIVAGLVRFIELLEEPSSESWDAAQEYASEKVRELVG